jgi:beta-lactam-binding protein with PASTA domain
VGLQPRFSFITQAGGVVGAVIGQLPVAGERVPHGSTVVLSISVPGTVPDVSGMPLERARAALQNAGYRIGNIAQTQEGDSGRVVRTEPGANADFKAGSSVTIYYNGAIVTPEPGSSPH